MYDFFFSLKFSEKDLSFDQISLKGVFEVFNVVCLVMLSLNNLIGGI